MTIHATSIWEDIDYPKNHGMGNGQKDVPKITFPAPDDPDVQRCLNCTLPEEACEHHLGCPFTPPYRRRALENKRKPRSVVHPRDDQGRFVEKEGA